MPRKVLASAPSQAFLFGEHAVLYGYPALAAGVERRAKAEVELLEDKLIEISSEQLGEILKWRPSEYLPEGPLSPLARCLWDLMTRRGFSEGLKVVIRSDVPVSSGMASSASVSAAIAAAALKLIEGDFHEDDLLEEVYLFEKSIHGKASKTGPACAVYGGYVWVEWRNGEMKVSRIELGNKLTFLIGRSSLPSDTRKTVSHVASLVEKREYVTGHVLKAIGELTLAGRRAILEGDLETVGELMNMNHELLSALGVSCRELDEIVWEMRSVGALGAKLSGGGGGGCVLGLFENPEGVSLVSAEESFVVKVSDVGYRVEVEVP